MAEIEISEKDLLFGIIYSCRDYTLPNCTYMEPWVEQLYAQMMGWA